MPETNFHPLVVDLDGTLIRSDSLVESIVRLVKRSPFNLGRILCWLFLGKAVFKERIATYITLSPEHLPYNESLLEYLRAEKARGRTLVLATAAHHSIARGVADHLGCFDRVLASESTINLKGKNKLEAIKGAVGDDFVYAGDSRADLPVWAASRAAILVGASAAITNRVRKQVAIEKEFQDDASKWKQWVKALRVHQWLKNLLIFVPLLTAFSFANSTSSLLTIAAFFAFSFAASATYIVNDLLDLESDRTHMRKRLRPFARGDLSIVSGIFAAIALHVLAFYIAFAISSGFLIVLALYVATTSFYSWWLKSYVLMDVILLAILYAIRIVAGSVAIHVTTSSWLIAFSVFIFLSLALVKRCSELVSIREQGIAGARGRDYQVSDLTVLWPLGISAALSAIIIFGLFISAPETRSHYNSPDILWAVAIGLVYWLGRLWIKTARGEMHDDPLVYAIKNKGSMVTIGMMILAVFVARIATLNVTL